jgi:Rrf2 family cysteine metabolism transcriptional repressor
MKLSTKSTYGLRAMLNIALGEEKAPVSINDIARKEGISVAYLEQLLNRLRRAGLIESIRGPKGGYRLADDPDKLTVRDIVKTLDGEIVPVHCIEAKKNRKGACKKTKDCVPKIVWFKLHKAIDDCLNSITLEDLCRETKRIGK